jgi:hypothetical protein
MRAQSELSRFCPEAEALPPFVPVWRLSSLPSFKSLDQARRVIWHRVDIATPWTVQVSRLGHLGLPIDAQAWKHYREALLSISDLVDLVLPDDAGFAWLEMLPWFFLSRKPESGVLVYSSQSLDRPLVINAPQLAVLRITEETPDQGIHAISWELLASHRVCKAR